MNPWLVLIIIVWVSLLVPAVIANHRFCKHVKGKEEEK